MLLVCFFEIAIEHLNDCIFPVDLEIATGKTISKQWSVGHMYGANHTKIAETVWVNCKHLTLVILRQDLNFLDELFHFRNSHQFTPLILHLVPIDPRITLFIGLMLLRNHATSHNQAQWSQCNETLLTQAPHPQTRCTFSSCFLRSSSFSAAAIFFSTSGSSSWAAPLSFLRNLMFGNTTVVLFFVEGV